MKLNMFFTLKITSVRAHTHANTHTHTHTLKLLPNGTSQKDLVTARVERVITTSKLLTE